MFIRMFHLIVKELHASLRDPQARIVLVGPPLLQLLIFSFAITQEVKNFPLALYNKDIGKDGYALLQRFEHSPLVSRIITVSSQEEIEPLIDEQKVLGVIVIPQNFSQKISSGQTADVQVLLDGRRSNAALVVGGYTAKIINKFFAEKNITAVSSVQTRNWFNVNLDPRKSTVPSLVCVLATVLGMLIAGLSIARERENGTFEQLLVSPLTPFEILAGKAIPTVLLTTCSAAMMIGLTVFALGIPLRGSFLLLLLSMDLFLLSVIGIGLFISSLAKTQQQAVLGVILILPTSIMLSGFTTPAENMPLWLQYLTVVNPVKWYLIIVKGVFMKDMGFQEVAYNCIPLVFLSAITLTAAAVMFKRRME